MTERFDEDLARQAVQRTVERFEPISVEGVYRSAAEKAVVGERVEDVLDSPFFEIDNDVALERLHPEVLDPAPIIDRSITAIDCLPAGRQDRAVVRPAAQLLAPTVTVIDKRRVGRGRYGAVLAAVAALALVVLGGIGGLAVGGSFEAAAPGDGQPPVTTTPTTQTTNSLDSDQISGPSNDVDVAPSDSESFDPGISEPGADNPVPDPTEQFPPGTGGSSEPPLTDPGAEDLEPGGEIGPGGDPDPEPDPGSITPEPVGFTKRWPDAETTTGFMGYVTAAEAACTQSIGRHGQRIVVNGTSYLIQEASALGSTQDDSMGRPMYAGFTHADDEILIGTPEADNLAGHAGDDIVCGLGGDDYLTGNVGDDILIGGDGLDISLADHGPDGQDLIWADEEDFELPREQGFPTWGDPPNRSELEPEDMRPDYCLPWKGGNLSDSVGCMRPTQ